MGWEHYLFQIWLLLQFESFAINDKHVLTEYEEKDWNGSSSKAVSESVNKVSLVQVYFWMTEENDIFLWCKIQIVSSELVFSAVILPLIECNLSGWSN